MSIKFKPSAPWFVGLGILFPLFFTLSDGIYRKAETLTDSGGALLTLPLPTSILVCLIALLTFRNQILTSKPAMAAVCGTLLALLISLWLGGDGVTSAQRKLLMIVQVTAPMIGLFVGVAMAKERYLIAHSFLVVLSILVPLQLFVGRLGIDYGAAWSGVPADYLYLFTIYSNQQYVFVIFMVAFAFSLSHLWPNHKMWLSVILALLVVYVLKSRSYLAMGAFGLTILLFAIQHLTPAYQSLKKSILCSFGLLLVAISLLVIIAPNKESKPNVFSGAILVAHEKVLPILRGEIPPNVSERFGDWRLFGQRIVSSGKTLLVGHPEPMPREIRSSPHNWYLDVAHTFGIIGLVPIILLLAYTGRRCWQCRNELAAETWWMVGCVCFLVLVDSNFKVTLRQPYPGIFAFFLWGLLLAHLDALAKARISHQDDAR